MIPEGHAGRPAPRSQTDAGAKSITNRLKHTENRQKQQNASKNQGKYRNVIKKHERIIEIHRKPFENSRNS